MSAVIFKKYPLFKVREFGFIYRHFTPSRINSSSTHLPHDRRNVSKANLKFSPHPFRWAMDDDIAIHFPHVKTSISSEEGPHGTRILNRLCEK